MAVGGVGEEDRSQAAARRWRKNRTSVEKLLRARGVILFGKLSNFKVLHVSPRLAGKKRLGGNKTTSILAAMDRFSARFHLPRFSHKLNYNTASSLSSLR